MHKVLALTAVAALLASPAMADPAAVSVRLGPEMQDRVENLGQRDVDDQVERLTYVVERELTRRGALDGARIELVLTDLRPNRPTLQQLTDRPGLDTIRSISIGGAAFEGQVTLSDGRTEPIRYDWFSPNIRDAWGHNTWQDADRAYDRLARRLAEGRFTR